MRKGIALIRRTGFTLIEVLVTVVVIGVLAAVVIPAVTAQVTAGDSSRVVSDLNNLRTGIENFDIAVRQFPGDVDDLVNKPGTSQSTSGQLVDRDIYGSLYTGASSWAGPYIEAALPSSATSSTASVSATAFSTGYSATINNKFLGCTMTDTSAACATASPDYIAVQIDNLTVAQAGSLNDVIDGTGETNSSTAGKFRVFTSGTTTAYYFASPLH